MPIEEVEPLGQRARLTSRSAPLRAPRIQGGVFAKRTARRHDDAYLREYPWRQRPQHVERDRRSLAVSVNYQNVNVLTRAQPQKRLANEATYVLSEVVP